MNLFGTTTKDRGNRMWNRACSATKLESNGMRREQSMQAVAALGFTIAKRGTTRWESSACNTIGQEYSTEYKDERNSHHDLCKGQTMLKLLQHVHEVNIVMCRA